MTLAKTGSFALRIYEQAGTLAHGRLLTTYLGSLTYVLYVLVARWLVCTS